MATLTTEERNAAVLAVLKAEGRPIGPTAIARKINQDWCLGPSRPGGLRFLPLSSAIVPVLRRIGAINHGGKWALGEHLPNTPRCPTDEPDPLKWVKCRDRMPDDGALVLAWFPNAGYPIWATHQAREWRASLGMHELTFQDYEISHWMPLNAPTLDLEEPL